ncbi:acetyl-CoA C-acyltransferase [Bacillus horti]|uniref:acetyl-CoA C-acyltransferase n=1 Tax=Caldalkalibacillus horti TaxID=77523 RepID=A0ABT9W0S9_9BACI|nr:acetyl-CoA C-acyltransferase [Bacillus horti]MDQ0166699.1 3-oxo-5,6-didehydrosuberyl-CoA/3-oxoadipyl-CoA thiolase [Bacillus horti]
MGLEEVVIIDAVRTPIGRYKGALKRIRPDDLAASVLKELTVRNPSLPLEQIDDVIIGCANQAGEDNRNIARMALLLAGLPVEVPGSTVNRLCGSGLDAVQFAARSIASGEGDIYIAGGAESMTRAPYVMAKAESDFQRGDHTLFDTTLGWRFVNRKLEQQYDTLSMPETAEEVARRFNISRQEQDQFAYSSQQRYQQANQANKFDHERMELKWKDGKGKEHVFLEDEHPRAETTLEKLATLPPLFKHGTVTAGNASGINDGAAAVLLMSAKRAKELGLKPIARYVASAVAGVEPNIMGIGPVPAVQKALGRAGLHIADIGRVELNEAFAAQAIACMRLLELDPLKVNVNGGAIALGHPLGASGARILTTLIYELKQSQSRYGLAAMCIGVGQGIATIVEAVE